MIVVAVIAVVVVIGVGIAFSVRSRGDALSEVDRFHRARQMTTSWSEQYGGGSAGHGSAAAE